MPRYRAKSPATGDVITFEWDGKKPPTRADILRMESDMLDQEESERQANTPAPPPKPGYFEQVGQNIKGMIHYRPDEAVPELLEGLGQIVSGEGQEDYPRVAGVAKAARGLFGTVGVPLGLAGAVIAPGPTAMALGSLALGGPLINKGVEGAIPNAPQEVKDVAEIGGNVILGGVAGKLRHRGKPTPTTTATPAPQETGVSTWVRRGRQPGDPPGYQRGNPYSVVVEMPDRQLPPGGLETYPTRPQLPEGGLEVYPVQPELSGRPIAQLPPPARVFHMPPATPPEPPVVPPPPTFSFNPGGVVPSFTLGEGKGGREIVPNKPSLEDIFRENRVVEPAPPEQSVEDFWQNAPTTRAEQQLDYNRIFDAQPTPPPKAPVKPPISVPPATPPTPAPVQPPVELQPAPKQVKAAQPKPAAPVVSPEEVESGKPKPESVAKLKGETPEFTGEPSREHIEGWSVDPGAIPGEPTRWMGEDFDSSPAAIFETDTPKGRVYEPRVIVDDEPRSLGVFNDLKSAVAAAEAEVKKTSGPTLEVADTTPVPVNRSAPEQKPPSTDDIVSQALSQDKPTKPAAPPPAAPPPSPQLPAVAAPEGPQKPAVATPKAKPVESTEDIVNQALGPVKPPQAAPPPPQAPAPVQPPPEVKPPVVVKAPTTKPAPKVVELTRKQGNDALELLKVRKSITPEVLQEKLGFTFDQAKAVLGDFIRRGLAEQKGKAVNYKEVVDISNREVEPEIPTPPPTETTPKPVRPPVPEQPKQEAAPEVAPPEPPKAETPGPVNPPGEKKVITTPEEKPVVSDERLAEQRKNAQLIKDQIKSYEDKGLDAAAKKKRAYLKKYLKSIGKTEDELFGAKPKESRVAEEPKTSNKKPAEKKVKLSDDEKRDIMARIDELEEIQDTKGSLTEAERAEYRELNMKITGLERFWMDESGVDRMIPRLRDLANWLRERGKRRGPEKGTFRKNYLYSGESVLNGEGAAGERLAKSLRNARTTGEKMAGKWSVRYAKATEKLGGDDFDQMVQALQGELDPSRLNAATAEAYKVVRRILDEVHHSAVAVGVEEKLPNGQKITTRYRKDYWPMKFNPDFWTVSGKTRKSLAQKLVDKGEARNLVEAEKFIEDIIEPQAENIMGHLQRPRRVNIQEFARRDRAVLYEYFEEAGRKIAEVEEFGTKATKLSYPEEVANALEAIRKEGGDYQTSAEIAKAYFGRSPLSHAESKLWQKFSSFEVATKLGMAVISNLSQPVYVTLVTGHMPMFKAVAQMIAHPSKARMIAMESGSTLPGITHDVQAQAGLTSANFGSKVLHKTGFTKVEMKNRTVATLTGMYHASRMFEKLQRNPQSKYVRRQIDHWLGLDADTLLKQGKLTRDDLLTAGKTLADRTQFRSGPLDLPWTWNQNLPMKVLTLFKNFAFNQTKFMKDAVLKELREGNVRPLLPLFTTVPIVGTLIDRLKRFLNGRDQPAEFWDTVFGAYTANGAAGIVADMAMRASYGKLAESLAGVGLSDAANLGEAVVKRDPRPALRVASPVGRLLTPSKEKSGGGGGIGSVGPIK